jgi:divalent metal cation (Fe/Co/Zn/Cd) transporter
MNRTLFRALFPMARRASSSKVLVYVALTGNLLVTLTKFGAAWWTGSSAMLSEAVHSLVDTSNQLLLLYGLHRGTKPAGDLHPLGYGREIYFWSFIVALLMFTIGAGVTLLEGISHIRTPGDPGAGRRSVDRHQPAAGGDRTGAVA